MLLVYDVYTAGLVRVADTVTLLCHVHHFGSEGRADELRTDSAIVTWSRQHGKHVRNSSSVLSVEIGVDFVKEIERSRIAALNGKHERKSAKTLLPTAQLLDALLFVVFAIEAHADPDSPVALDRIPFLIVTFQLLSALFVALALDDQLASTSRDELLEDIGKLSGYLPERAVNRFVLSQI